LDEVNITGRGGLADGLLPAALPMGFSIQRIVNEKESIRTLPFRQVFPFSSQDPTYFYALAMLHPCFSYAFTMARFDVLF
jgi:hypothetical protein